jgi:serine phosphatase RsbU (regulator of sigma subunit)
LLVYTDGLTEVYKEDYEEFGESRLLEAFQGSAALDGADTLVELWNTIGEFSGNQPQVDDMTALAVSRTPRMNPSNPSTGAS